MNISLITAEKALLSWAEDACHNAPSAHITALTRLISPSLPLPSPCIAHPVYLFHLLSLFSIFTLVIFAELFTLSHLHHSPFPVSVTVISSFTFITPLFLPFSSCSGWIENCCLLWECCCYLPYWPTNRKEFQVDMSLGFLFFRLPSISACQGCVCVFVSHTQMGIFFPDRGMLWHVAQLCHSWGQNHLIRFTCIEHRFSVRFHLFGFNWWG